MKYLAALMLLIFSTTCFGEASRYLAEPNSWIVVIGAVKDCPDFSYRILDAQKLQGRDSAPLAGAAMSELNGLSGKEIETRLQARDDLSKDVVPESLKVLIYKAALPPEILKRLVVQASNDTSGECHEPTHQHDPGNRNRRIYQGDGPDDISIEGVKAVA